MSELKPYIGPNPTDHTLTEFYLKSEADNILAWKDKEIASLKDSIGKLLKAKTEQVMDEVLQRCLIYGEGFVPAEHAMRLVADIRHHKHNRCLAMAYAEWLKQMNLCNYPDSILYRKAARRERKWKEMAEKFKQGLVVGVDKATGTDKTVVINYNEDK